MKIGNINFEQQPLFLAPMEDVTDIGFRMLCKRFGAAMVYTEFVSAEALVRSVKSTVSKLTIADEERPVGIQIYGRDVPQMVEAARIVEAEAHPDVIDLNFGCPVKKVAGKGAGAGMLQKPELLLEITREVVKAVSTPGIRNNSSSPHWPSNCRTAAFRRSPSTGAPAARCTQDKPTGRSSGK